MSLTESKIRFSGAVHAIESTPKSLRKWLQNENLKLYSEGDREGWFSFNYLDISLFAIMRPLVDFGLPISAASGIARAALEFFPDILTLEQATPKTLVFIWDAHRIIVWPNDTGWDLRLINIHVELRESLPPAHLVIDVASLMKRAFERLGENVSLEA
jgi:hypothetical protein